jgi:hypothetical protein
MALAAIPVHAAALPEALTNCMNKADLDAVCALSSFFGVVVLVSFAMVVALFDIYVLFLFLAPVLAPAIDYGKFFL